MDKTEAVIMNPVMTETVCVNDPLEKQQETAENVAQLELPLTEAPVVTEAATMEVAEEPAPVVE